MDTVMKRIKQDESARRLIEETNYLMSKIPPDMKINLSIIPILTSANIYYNCLNISELDIIREEIINQFKLINDTLREEFSMCMDIDYSDAPKDFKVPSFIL